MLYIREVCVRDNANDMRMSILKMHPKKEENEVENFEGKNNKNQLQRPKTNR